MPFLPACADALNPVIRLDGAPNNDTWLASSAAPHRPVTSWRSDDLAWHTARYDAEARRCCHALAGDYAKTVQDARRQSQHPVLILPDLAQWPPLLELPAADDDKGHTDAQDVDDVDVLGEPAAQVAPQGPQAEGQVLDYERVNLALAKDGAKVVAAHPEARKPHALLDQDGDTFMKSDCQVQ